MSKKKVKKLASESEVIRLRWDYPANYPFLPEHFSIGSKSKVFFICLCGKQLLKPINMAVKWSGKCIKCFNKEKNSNSNFINKTQETKRKNKVTINPASSNKIIVEQWDYDRNLDFPNDVFVGSGEERWFKCKNCNINLLKKICRAKDWKGFCKHCDFSNRKNRIYKVPSDRNAKLNHNIVDLWSDKNNDAPENYCVSSKIKKWFNCKLCSNTRFVTVDEVGRGSSLCISCRNKQNTNTKARKAAINTPCINNKYIKKFRYVSEELLSNYSINSHKVFDWYCKKHGRIFKKSIKEMAKGIGCSDCLPTSRGEEEVIRILTKYNIKFQREYSYDDLVSKKGNKLRFDFYLSDYNWLLEFDGIQHFQNSNRFLASRYKKTKVSDKLKDAYCKKKGIKLIRIPYYDFDRIEEIIQRELGLSEEGLRLEKLIDKYKDELKEIE